MGTQVAIMTKEELAAFAAREALVWSKKSIRDLRHELKEAVGYERDCEDGWLQFEVILLEDTTDYVHVGVGCDDGSERWARSPICTSFLVYSDGRVHL